MSEDISVRRAEPIRFTCPNCQVVIKSDSVRPGAQFVCPKCSASGIVPHTDDGGSAGYGLGDIPKERPPAPTFLSRPLPEEPEDSEDGRANEGRSADSAETLLSLPHHPMIDGIFDFFVSKEIAGRWVALTISLAVAVGLLLATLVIGVMMLPFSIVAGLMWVVPACVQFLNIATETSNGNRMIDQFPDVVWIDWMQDAFYVIVPAILAGTAAFAAGGGIPIAALRVLVMTAVFVLVFPVFILSALEQQACYAVLSLRVARSFSFAGNAWLIFFGGTGVLLFATHTITSGTTAIVAMIPAILFLIIGPMMALLQAAVMVTALMIYFRLLGRLAWVIGEKDKEGEWKDEG